MKARTVKMSLLAATFALVSAINANAAPVDATVNVGDPEFQAKIQEILTAPFTKEHKNKVREDTMKRMVALRPLEMDVVDPKLMSLLKEKIKKQVMTQLRGTMTIGANPTVENMGQLPGQIAPPPF